MPKSCVLSLAVVAAFSVYRPLEADETKEAPPDHYRATITVEYNRPKLTSLGVRDFPSLVDDVNTFLSRREFTLQDLEAMHVWGSSASLKDVARFKMTFAREPEPPKETKQPEQPAMPPAIIANAQIAAPAQVEQKTVAQPVATTNPPVQPQIQPAAADPTADTAAEGEPTSTFHGRLPAHYTQVGVTDTQRQKIYSIQSSFDAKITSLKNQLSEASAKRDAEVRAVLTADQQKQLDKLTGAATKAQPVQKSPPAK
jgi:hypothetical protein